MKQLQQEQRPILQSQDMPKKQNQIVNAGHVAGMNINNNKTGNN